MPAHASFFIVVTGGYGNVFFPIFTNAMDKTVTAPARAHKKGGFGLLILVSHKFTLLGIPVSADHQSKLTFDCSSSHFSK